MKLRKIFAVLAASVMTLTAGLIPEAVSSAEMSVQQVYAAEKAPAYKNIGEFFETAYDYKYCTFYDGTKSDNYINIMGRTYYQGIKFDTSASGYTPPCVSFNVENIRKISFDFGRLDNTSVNDTKLKIYSDGEWWKDIDIKANEYKRNVVLDVSKMSTIKFFLDDTDYLYYGLGNFNIDDLDIKKPCVIPEYADAASFLDSAYESRYSTFYKGDKDNEYMKILGRTYYQGIKFDTSASGYTPPYAAFNVENVKKVSFDLGRLNDTPANNAVLKIYTDGEWKQDIEIKPHECQKNIVLDVSEASTLKIMLDDTDYLYYGLGNFNIENMKIKKPCVIPEYTDIASFLEEAYESQYCTFYDGTKDNNYMNIMGRKYYQGVKFDTSASGYTPPYVSFNVENVKKISFDFGRIDDTNECGAKLKLYRDGEWWKDIEVGANELKKNIELDVSEMNTIRILLDDTDYLYYGLGNLNIDDLPVQIPCEVPEYSNATDFLKAGFNSSKCTFYDGSKDNAYMVIKGKKYYQGVELSSSGGKNAVTYNVENVSKVSFVVGKLDNTAENDAKLQIYRDGEWWQDIEVGANDLAKEVILHVSNMDTLKIAIDRNGDKSYGLANFVIHNYVDGVCTICGKECKKHVFENGVCKECSLVCKHKYSSKDGLCTICKTACNHIFEESECTVCGYICKHKYENSVCTECAHVCEHESYTDGVCAECGLVCEHSYENGVCTICKLECAHEFEDGVCSVCGIEKKPETTAATTKITTTSTTKATTTTKKTTTAKTTSQTKATTAATTTTQTTATEETTTAETTAEVTTTEAITTTEPPETTTAPQPDPAENTTPKPDAPPEESFDFKEDDNDSMVIVSCNITIINVTVPQKIDGKEVTKIVEEAFAGCSNLKNIVFENKDCEIYDSPKTIPETVVIYGYENSTAQKYAQKYNRKFMLLKAAFAKGDANCDGNVNARDCAYIARMLASDSGWLLPVSADFNDDGIINVRDAAALARHLASKS